MPDVKSFIKDNFQKVKTFVTDPTMEQKNRRFNVIKTLAAALLAIIITCIVLALARETP